MLYDSLANVTIYPENASDWIQYTTTSNPVLQFRAIESDYGDNCWQYYM